MIETIRDVSKTIRLEGTFSYFFYGSLTGHADEPERCRIVFFGFRLSMHEG